MVTFLSLVLVRHTYGFKQLVKRAKIAIECTSRGVMRSRVLKITRPAAPWYHSRFGNPRKWVVAVVRSYASTRLGSREATFVTAIMLPAERAKSVAAKV